MWKNMEIFKKLKDYLRRNPKFLVYDLIISLPLILLIIIFTNFAFQIIYINSLNYDRIESELENSLRGEGGSELNFTVENGTRYYEYNDQVYGGTINNGKIAFDYAPEDYLIYVFGGSSAVSPTQDNVFAYYLEKELNELGQKKVRVFNFGRSGVDSNTVKLRVNSTINIKEPDLIVIYSGHNDYNLAYKIFIKPNFYIISKNFILNGLLRSAVKDDARKIHKIEDVDGKLIEALQNVGLLNIKVDKFDRFDEIILRKFSHNMNDIIDITNERDIPVIFMAEISNLEFRPTGTKITGNFYLKGINEKDYTKRINYLIAAKDSELFSFNIRTKSELNEFLRGLDAKNVYILDLEKELISENFEFDYNYFSDDAHLTPQGHMVVTQHLYNFILKNDLCCG